MQVDEYLVLRIVELDREAAIIDDLLRSRGHQEQLELRREVCLKLSHNLQSLRRRVKHMGLPDITDT